METSDLERGGEVMRTCQHPTVECELKIRKRGTRRLSRIAIEQTQAYLRPMSALDCAWLGRASSHVAEPVIATYSV
jgi:hypothetical protein